MFTLRSDRLNGVALEAAEGNPTQLMHTSFTCLLLKRTVPRNAEKWSSTTTGSNRATSEYHPRRTSTNITEDFDFSFSSQPWRRKVAQAALRIAVPYPFLTFGEYHSTTAESSRQSPRLRKGAFIVFCWHHRAADGLMATLSKGNRVVPQYGLHVEPKGFISDGATPSGELRNIM